MSMEAGSWDPSSWSVDECVEYFPDLSSCNDSCHDQASCTNGACVCDEGYYGDGANCVVLVNECTAGTDECDVNAFCTDTTTAYGCICNDGYTGDGFTCSILCNDGFEVDIENESCVSTCPVNWTFVNDECIQIFCLENAVTWYGASDACILEHAILAPINNAETNKIVKASPTF